MLSWEWRCSWSSTDRWCSTITLLRCFFPGFDRFIPGSDRFIPGFNRFIPASIPVTGPPPPTIKNISSKKMYFLNLISSFLFHWFEITQSRNIQQCPECIYSLKIQSTPIQNYSGLNSMPQAVAKSREIARASHFMRRGWGRLWYLSSKFRGNMATRTGIALDSNFDLYLVSKILIVKSQIC